MQTMLGTFLNVEIGTVNYNAADAMAQMVAALLRNIFNYDNLQNQK